MRYMMLLYSNQSAWEAAGEPEETIIRDHMGLRTDLERTGRYKTCDALPVTS